jgi:hypothetical protein
MEEPAIGLHPLDLEDAIVADVDHLPEARGVRHAHDAQKNSSFMASSTSLSQW